MALATEKMAMATIGLRSVYASKAMHVASRKAVSGTNLQREGPEKRSEKEAIEKKVF